MSSAECDPGPNLVRVSKLEAELEATRADLDQARHKLIVTETLYKEEHEINRQLVVIAWKLARG